MRIVLLNQYYAPDEAATAQIAGDLGAFLAAAGHHVEAICCDRSYANPQRRYVRNEVVDGVSVHRVRTSAFGRSSKTGRMFDYAGFVFGSVVQLLSGRRPDVVIALTTPPMIAAIPLLLRHLRRFKVVFWSMDVYPDLAFRLGAIGARSAAGRIATGVASWILRSADVTVALGETMAVRLRESGGRNVAVVHNWADEQTIPADGDRPAAEGPSRPFVLLYSGNLGLAHEFDTLIAAATQLATELPDIQFSFAGVGPRLSEVQAATRDLPNVEFRSFVPRSRLGESLRAADVHLVTLRPDMAGLLVPSKIYGILAAARPTIYIGPMSGEVHDILSEGRCGTTIRNGDVSGLVAAIRSYASDPVRRQSEGANARRVFESRFTKANGLRSFQQIVERL
jgi:putative colanic acid biosynthesis glycosyltransferase WcaI